jgi:hypothetical protein
MTGMDERFGSDDGGAGGAVCDFAEDFRPMLYAFHFTALRLWDYSFDDS